ncbi:hypothetical protein D3875_01110 [Deinococcus cavernae]|uniref:Uncharacterized protein n=1 Tax=Deinococcus cavernae TaxID=2320857 RepID=A0A418VHR5_9DEIO|nr:hypothetical protein [Deinococcus cavernae]RJF75676.1 hypothetical protein D3875_01110 [Deinococcus cavernae]
MSVDLVPAPRQFTGDPAIPIFFDDRFDLTSQFAVWVSMIAFGMSVETGAADGKDITKANHREFWMRVSRILDHLEPLLVRSFANGFFKTVFSRASCPQYRSSSAIRLSHA